ncbi:MAG: A/G-specific adenine glycosylase [Tangfeifania sp.]
MSHFTAQIYRWYTKNKRELPWRETSDPYKIWISEIILQQTRVDQGTAYYYRFIERFPTVKKLAEAGEDDVLKNWQGLGYYSRARNIHSTARYIQNELGGKFPDTHKAILQLKGIGPYTAAAIASFAFNLPYPALDGNVYRVLSRYFGIETPVDSTKGKKEFHNLANEFIPAGNPGFHNQAMMEFGALQCTPKPNCSKCPVFDSCFAYRHKMVAQFPVKEKKARQRKRYFYYFLIENGEFIYLEKRLGNDIWKNLYQFPLVETTEELTEHDITELKNISFLNGCAKNLKKITPVRKHVLSHQIIFARLIHLETDSFCSLKNTFIKIEKKNLNDYAVPRLVEKFIQETLNL